MTYVATMALGTIASGWEDLIAAASVLTLAATGVALIPWLWRLSDPEKRNNLRALPGPWGQRDESGRWLRSEPVFFVGCLLFFALAIFGALSTVGTASTALTVCALVVVVMFIIALFLWATVFLYGRPERFVPPWLRDLI